MGDENIKNPIETLNAVKDSLIERARYMRSQATIGRTSMPSSEEDIEAAFRKIWEHLAMQTKTPIEIVLNELEKNEKHTPALGQMMAQLRHELELPPSRQWKVYQAVSPASSLRTR